MSLTPREMAEKAANKLIGSCESIGDLGEGYEALELNSEFCARLDELCFECEKCNWWYGVDELSGNNDELICTECADD